MPHLLRLWMDIMTDLYNLTGIALGFAAVIGVGSILVLINDAIEHAVTQWGNR